MKPTPAGSECGVQPSEDAPLVVALVGNPNCGKTTLFNALTGMRQKVGNYPGVTVEKKEGHFSLQNGRQVLLIDLPGLYSLVPHSPDEEIARAILLGLREDTPRPDLILNAVDASNLERNLYLTSQLLDIGTPIVVALTMTDHAEKEGIVLDVSRLENAIGVPVRPVVAFKKEGIDALQKTLENASQFTAPAPVWKAPEAAQIALAELQTALEKTQNLGPRIAFSEAVSLLMQAEDFGTTPNTSPELNRLLRTARTRLADADIDFPSVAIEARYAWIAEASRDVQHREPPSARKPISFNERIDRVLMHPFWGYILFFCVMSLVFQSIFLWAQTPMSWIEQGQALLQEGIKGRMAEGDLRDLITDGVIGGVGSAVVFLPQILILFFFVNLLEDSGYMARAAFLMDKLMSRVGLHGKSFIPLLSSFACAIPAVMATRTIGDRKARLITILVAPLMSCSARLPVYALMIGAFVPNKALLSLGSWKILTLPGVTLIAMYFLGMIAAFCMAGLFHHTLLKGASPVFLLELPPYRMPHLKTVVYSMFERAGLFLKRATTLIMAISIVLWFLATYPKRPELHPDQQVAQSYAGKMGHALEPVIAPLGFDWKMGIGLVASFAAREVFVSAMGTVYNVEKAEEEGEESLRQKMQEDVDPRTGKKVFTPLVAISLMVYYVLAMQCMSTIAVVKRETNGWKWPLFQLGYMTALAWLASFVVYQGGRMLGWG